MADEHYVAQPTSRAKITQFAAQVRQSIGLDKGFYFPVTHFIELVLPRIDPEFQPEIVDAEEIPGCYAETRPALHLMRIREDVYEAALANNGRARFTLAHELGHYLMHGEGVVSLARTQNHCDIPWHMKPGWQANTFAAELLAPLRLIKGRDASFIADACKVSLQVAEIQLSKLQS